MLNLRPLNGQQQAELHTGYTPTQPASLTPSLPGSCRDASAHTAHTTSAAVALAVPSLLPLHKDPDLYSSLVLVAQTLTGDTAHCPAGPHFLAVCAPAQLHRPVWMPPLHSAHRAPVYRQPLLPTHTHTTAARLPHMRQTGPLTPPPPQCGHVACGLRHPPNSRLPYPLLPSAIICVTPAVAWLVPCRLLTTGT
jgi:hypothetical protein